MLPIKSSTDVTLPMLPDTILGVARNLSFRSHGRERFRKICRVALVGKVRRDHRFTLPASRLLDNAMPPHGDRRRSMRISRRFRGREYR